MELLGTSREELQAYCKTLGEPVYRGGQIYHALYAERKFDVASFTNLPAALREKLRNEASAGIPKPAAMKPAAVEAVFMPSEGRQTICISTQAGCAVDCQFCLTAQLGLIRNLSAGEIVAQVLLPLAEMERATTDVGSS